MPPKDRLYANPGLWAIVLLALIAVIGPELMRADPRALSREILLPPSAEHLLGTDELGRDVFAQVVYGSRVSLGIGIIAALASTVIAVIVGSLAGFFGPLVDIPVMRISEVFQVIPSIVLAAVITAIVGPGLDRIILVIVLLSWSTTARIVRGEVLRIARLEYVDVARCQGRSSWWILSREVIPNALRPVVAVATLTIAMAILLEASLGFLGLAPADIPSWGRLLNSGQRFLFRAWWLSVFPGIAIFLTVISFNMLGDHVGRMFDPRARDKA